MTHVISNQPVLIGPTMQTRRACCDECGGDCTGSCACGVEALAHPRYSLGMLLEARHMALQHRYHALRMNTHDIRLHDFGTVCGLRVEPHPSPDCVNRYVILRPGIALDCCGREIIVPDDLYVPLLDGARSGWCGAPCAAPPAQPAQPALTAGGTATTAVPPPAHRPTLYVLLRYQECDTDPIPSYVRACGCCESPCEHGDCVPSVTREGYEVIVSSTPPPPWVNPVGAAFCAWLDARLHPAASLVSVAAPPAEVTLQHALCDVITDPCADFCAGGNDSLLLATVTFTDDDTLVVPIDNCTNRRLVLSTGAIVDAIECLTTAVVACCGGTHDPAVPQLQLDAHVVPGDVTLAAGASAPQLTYTATVTNAGTTATASGFTIVLDLDASLTFDSATIQLPGGTPGAVPAPATPLHVEVPVAALPAGANAQLVVLATPTAAVTDGETVTSTAMVNGYPVVAPPTAAMPTTFHVAAPRVLIQESDFYKKFYLTAGLPTTMKLAALKKLLVPASAPGLIFAFDEAMDTSVPTSGAVAGASVTVVTTFVSLSGAATPYDPGNVIGTWDGATALRVNWERSSGFIDELSKRIGDKFTGTVMVTLAGGPEGGAPPNPAALRSAAPGTFLDGEVPSAAPFPAKSGDGTQGGDFVWTITVTS